MGVYRQAIPACACIALALLAVNAAAIDPGTVKGRLTYEGKAYVLRHVYAWQPPLQAGELWIYLTDNPLPPLAAQHDSRPEELAREKRFGGAKLIIRPLKPRLEDMKGVIYAHREDGYSVDKFNFGPGWQSLIVGERRVAGKIRSQWMNWTLEAEFSAPVSGSTGAVRTIIGAEARNSPQARVFVAFEQALGEKGLDAAGVYLTPEKLAEMRATIKRVGAATFQEFQERRRASTPQGEARRKQVERVDIDGDYARLRAGTGLDNLHTALFVKTMDGWKIAEW